MPGPALLVRGKGKKYVGKWHLGTGSNIPVRQGFDNYYGHYGGGSRYFPSGITNNSIKRDAAQAGNLISAYADSFYNTSAGTLRRRDKDRQVSIDAVGFLSRLHSRPG